MAGNAPFRGFCSPSPRPARPSLGHSSPTLLRRTWSWSLLVLVGLLPSSLHGAEGPVERVPLTATSYDVLYLISGGTLEGTVVEHLANGAVRFARIGRPPTVVDKDLISRIVLHRSLAEAIRLRGIQDLTTGDWADFQRTLRFIQEQAAKPPVAAAGKTGEFVPSTPQEIQAVGLELGTQALAKKAPVEIIAQIAAMAEAAGDRTAAIVAAKAGLVTDPNWTAGYEIQARQLTAAKDNEGMKALVVAWLARQPSAFQANRFQAGLAESAGDLRTATDCYRKGWELHRDGESAAGLLRCALIRGEYDDAARVAKAVADDGKSPPAVLAAAQASLGIALLGSLGGAPPAAIAALEKALGSGHLTPELTDQAQYDLGLARWRLGDYQAAKANWQKVKSPLAAAALAWAERQPVDPAGLPAELGPWISEHNAGIDLERQNPIVPPAIPGRAGRQVELATYAQILRTSGADEALRTLAAQPGIEALRWRIYGLLLAGRIAELDFLLDQLGETDGWGLAVRVHLAAVRRDQIQAKKWWNKLKEAPGAPKDYVTRLAREFAAENNDEISETFDWPAADAVGLGYRVSALGTGLSFRAKAGKLTIEGTQSAGPESVSVVWRPIPGDRLMFAQVVVERSQEAISGLELADPERKHAIQVGVKPDGNIAWRIMTDGYLGKWTVLGSGRIPKIEIERGRFIVASADTGLRQSVVSGLGRGTTLQVGIFTAAEPKSVVSVVIDDFVIDLNRTVKGGP